MNKPSKIFSLMLCGLFMTPLAACNGGGKRGLYAEQSLAALYDKFEGEIERGTANKPITLHVLENDTAKSSGYLKKLLDGFNEKYKDYNIVAVDANQDQYANLADDGPYGYGPDVLYQANDVLMKYCDGKHITPLPVDKLDAYDTLATEFKFTENLFDEAECLIELGEFDRAEATLEKYASKQGSAQYYYCKAHLANKRRDLLAAHGYAVQAYELDGEDPLTLYLLIEIQSMLQDYGSVAAYAEEYKKLRPDNEYGYCMCAEAYLVLENFAESSRNYYYLYSNIRRDEKYAALAAVTAARSGNKKRAALLRRVLKRRRSPYYQSVLYVSRPAGRYKSYNALSRLVNKLNYDEDFLLPFATFLTGVGKLLSAAYILDILLRESNPPFELVAQQIRTAVKLGDDKLFSRFLDYYVAHFVRNDDRQTREILSERFRA